MRQRPTQRPRTGVPGCLFQVSSRLWQGSMRYSLCVPDRMDALPETRQHDITAQTSHQLNASLERVRQARQVLHDASDRLTLTRQELENDPRSEGVRRARELLAAVNHQLAQTREQVEDDQPPNAAGPTTDD